MLLWYQTHRDDASFRLGQYLVLTLSFSERFLYWRHASLPELGIQKTIVPGEGFSKSMEAIQEPKKIVARKQPD